MPTPETPRTHAKEGEFTYGEDSQVAPQGEKPAIIDSVPWDPKDFERDTSAANTVANQPLAAGASVIHSRHPGTRYESGMPISLDAVTDPQTGDPQVPKLTPGS